MFLLIPFSLCLSFRCCRLDTGKNIRLFHWTCLTADGASYCLGGAGGVRGAECDLPLDAVKSMATVKLSCVLSDDQRREYNSKTTMYLAHRVVQRHDICLKRLAAHRLISMVKQYSLSPSHYLQGLIRFNKHKQ